MSTQFTYPTENIDLPSRGKLYPSDSLLSSGKIEMKYMTAKEEDILTNANYLQKGIAIDKLLESLIVTKVAYDDLLVGDKNALLLAARILGYGKDYDFVYGGQEYTVDLSKLELKPLHPDFEKATENKFYFKLPNSGTELFFKLLTHRDERLVEEELTGLKKINKENNSEFITRTRQMILSVNGNSDKGVIKDFVENYFLARDTREFRKYIKDLQPDVDLRFFPEDGPEGGVDIPIGVTFLWPDFKL